MTGSELNSVEALLKRASLSSLPPAGKRSAKRLAIFGVLLVCAWFFVFEPMLIPMAKAARRHTAETRVEVHREAILWAAQEAQLEPELVAAIIFAESSGRIDAHSKSDAYGLMQLRLPTAVEQAGKLGLPAPTPTDLMTDSYLNTRLGANYFRWVMNNEGEHVERSLVAYNAGRGRLRGWIKEAGSYAKWRAERIESGKSMTLAYAAKVLATRERFRDAGLFRETEPAGQ